MESSLSSKVLAGMGLLIIVAISALFVNFGPGEDPAAVAGRISQHQRDSANVDKSTAGNSRSLVENEMNPSERTGPDLVGPPPERRQARQPKKLPEVMLTPKISGTQLANFRITKSGQGVDIDLDDRAKLPAVFGAETAAKGITRMIDKITDSFVEEVTVSPDGAALTLHAWQEAVMRSNERFRALVGDEEFMAATRRAAKQFEPGRAQ